MEQGKSLQESNQHIERYGKDYFPISLSELFGVNDEIVDLELLKYYGFPICK